MADELRATFSLTHTKEPKDGIAAFVYTDDQTGSGVFSTTQSIGTSEEDVDLSAVGTEGWCYLKNLDTTNFVEWGKKDGSNNMQAIGKLKAGEFAWFRFDPGATLRMQANTAACNVFIKVFEN